jgi:ABC-type glycerol-3-phosphate transport system substrate-binding protein
MIPGMIAGWLILVGISLVFLGCGADEEKVATIKVINQSRWAKNIEKAVEQWNANNPGRKVQLDQLVIGYPQLKNKLMTAAGAGRPPDLSLIDYVWLAAFAKAGHLAPLDKIDREWFVNDYKEDFFPVFQKGEILDGHLWGVRTQTDMALLWYRKDWFSGENIGPPQTWEELVKRAKHFQKPKVRQRYGNSQFPLAMPLGTKARETLVYQLLPLFWSNGGGIFQDEKLVLNSRENIETLKFLSSLVNDHRIVSPEAISFEWNRAVQLFATGRAAMAFGGSYEKRMIQEVSGWSDKEFAEKVGYTLIPAGSAGQPSTTAGGMCYVVYQASPHKELAFQILRLAVSPENMKEFLLETYQHPPRKSIAESLDEEKYPFLAQTTNYLYKAQARPSFPEYSDLSDLIQEMIEKVVTEETEPASAVKEASQEILNLMDQGE